MGSQGFRIGIPGIPHRNARFPRIPGIPQRNARFPRIPGIPQRNARFILQAVSTGTLCCLHRDSPQIKCHHGPDGHGIKLNAPLRFAESPLLNCALEPKSLDPDHAT